jgi:hypothetical protein
MTAPVPATRACAKLLSERRDPARALRTRTGAPVMVPLLSALPDLADAVPEFERRRALAVLHVPRLDLPRGAALPAPAAVGVRGCVGLIVQRGLLSRNLCVAERPGIELFGPGDALDPGDLAAVPSAWTVHQPTSVLFLEKRFELAAGRWPGCGGTCSRARTGARSGWPASSRPFRSAAWRTGCCRRCGSSPSAGDT